MNTLPKMGRPSKTGLSVKELGMAVYQRKRLELLRGRPGHPERWTGLSRKQLGEAKYVKLWRELRRRMAAPDKLPAG